MCAECHLECMVSGLPRCNHLLSHSGIHLCRYHLKEQQGDQMTYTPFLLEVDMTNERAIQILEILISIEGDVIIGSEGKEALEKAIRSLRQEQPSEDLEKEIKRYIPRNQCPVPDLMEAVARHFAEWQKEQMLKDAVEGEVMMNALHPHEPRVTASYPNCPYKFGDKVKIVIVPDKEDKK